MGKAKKESEAAHAANNPIFNKDLGQHILKNPLVAAGIVEKVLWRQDNELLTRAFPGQHPTL